MNLNAIYHNRLYNAILWTVFICVSNVYSCHTCDYICTYMYLHEINIKHNIFRDGLEP